MGSWTSVTGWTVTATAASSLQGKAPNAMLESVIWMPLRAAAPVTDDARICRWAGVAVRDHGTYSKKIQGPA